MRSPHASQFIVLMVGDRTRYQPITTTRRCSASALSEREQPRASARVASDDCASTSSTTSSCHSSKGFYLRQEKNYLALRPGSSRTTGSDLDIGRTRHNCGLGCYASTSGHVYYHNRRTVTSRSAVLRVSDTTSPPPIPRLGISQYR